MAILCWGLVVVIKLPESVVRNSDAIISSIVISVVGGTTYLLYVWDWRATEALFGATVMTTDGNFMLIFFVLYTLVISLAVAQFHLRERYVLVYAIFTTGCGGWVYSFGQPEFIFSTVVIFAGASAFFFVILGALENEKSARKVFEAARIVSFERDKSRKLLLSILPESVADQIPDDGSHASVVEGYESISVLFADIANFTPLVERLSPPQLIRMLNDVFSRLDQIAKAHGIEKIKTIGDAYMMAAGVPLERQGHAYAIAACALDIAMLSGSMHDPEGNPIRFRVGIHTGPGVAGVIGSHKFAYDIWGATVNTAARLEAYGEPGRIHASDEVRQLLHDQFVFEARGLIDIKGKGALPTWWLAGQKPAPV